MWNSIVSVPDHRLFIYYELMVGVDDTWEYFNKQILNITTLLYAIEY